MDLRRRDFLRAAGLAGSGLALSLSACSSDSPSRESRAKSKPDGPPVPNTEFRAVWVASVANIDWPSKKGLPAATLRAEMLAILDRCVELRLNAVLLQVRPCCDAIYPSALEPWSEFLTGASGKPPEPEFDPLAEWIDQAHSRGLELHAWFNPFRAHHPKAEHPDSPTHITSTRPDLVRTWGDLKWLDPSEPDAREHSLKVMLDVVRRYDIDGVHLDDYFYPYPRDAKPLPGETKSTRKEEFPDDRQWSLYQQSGGKLSRSDWRRSHIDGFVAELYKRVKATRQRVMVGISPFGIWRPANPPVVEGFDAYEGLFADARKWLRDGSIDYMAPQLYWSVDAPKQPFGPLLDWWRSENVKHKQIWPGLYTSRIDGEGKWKPDEILRQISETRKRPTAGHVHFSMAAFTANRGGIVDLLKQDLYEQDAIVPGLDARTDTSVRVTAFTTPAQPSAADATTVPHVRVWWSAQSSGPSPTAPRRWIVQARYGKTWRTTAFAPAQSGADIAAADASGTPLDMLMVSRADENRRCSAPATLAGATSLSLNAEPRPAS